MVIQFVGQAVAYGLGAYGGYGGILTGALSDLGKITVLRAALEALMIKQFTSGGFERDQEREFESICQGLKIDCMKEDDKESCKLWVEYCTEN